MPAASVRRLVCLNAHAYSLGAIRNTMPTGAVDCSQQVEMLGRCKKRFFARKPAA